MVFLCGVVRNRSSLFVELWGRAFPHQKSRVTYLMKTSDTAHKSFCWITSLQTQIFQLLKQFFAVLARFFAVFLQLLKLFFDLFVETVGVEKAIFFLER